LRNEFFAEAVELPRLQRRVPPPAGAASGLA